MRPNWFVAFPLDGSFIRSLPPPPPLFRLFSPEDVHLTLTFLGSCGEAAARRGFAALEAELGAHPVAPLEVALAHVVAMGPKREYSALSALLGRGRAETEACMGRLRDIVSETATGRREKRAPAPHVTVARPARRASGASREAGLDWAEKLELSAVSARLDRLALYTWSEGNRRERLFQVVAELGLEASRDYPAG